MSVYTVPGLTDLQRKILNSGREVIESAIASQAAYDDLAARQAGELAAQATDRDVRYGRVRDLLEAVALVPGTITKLKLEGSGVDTVLSTNEDA